MTLPLYRPSKKSSVLDDVFSRALAWSVSSATTSMNGFTTRLSFSRA